MVPLKMKSELVPKPISIVTVPVTTILLVMVFEAPRDEAKSVEPSLRERVPEPIE